MYRHGVTAHLYLVGRGDRLHHAALVIIGEEFEPLRIYQPAARTHIRRAPLPLVWVRDVIASLVLLARSVGCTHRVVHHDARCGIATVILAARAHHHHIAAAHPSYLVAGLHDDITHSWQVIAHRRVIAIEGLLAQGHAVVILGLITHRRYAHVATASSDGDAYTAVAPGEQIALLFTEHALAVRGNDGVTALKLLHVRQHHVVVFHTIVEHLCTRAGHQAPVVSVAAVLDVIGLAQGHHAHTPPVSCLCSAVISLGIALDGTHRASGVSEIVHLHDAAAGIRVCHAATGIRHLPYLGLGKHGLLPHHDVVKIGITLAVIAHIDIIAARSSNHSVGRSALAVAHSRCAYRRQLGIAAFRHAILLAYGDTALETYQTARSILLQLRQEEGGAIRFYQLLYLGFQQTATTAQTIARYDGVYLVLDTLDSSHIGLLLQRYGIFGYLASALLDGQLVYGHRHRQAKVVIGKSKQIASTKGLVQTHCHTAVISLGSIMLAGHIHIVYLRSIHLLGVVILVKPSDGVGQQLLGAVLHILVGQLDAAKHKVVAFLYLEVLIREIQTKVFILHALHGQHPAAVFSLGAAAYLESPAGTHAVFHRHRKVILPDGVDVKVYFLLQLQGKWRNGSTIGKDAVVGNRNAAFVYLVDAHTANLHLFYRRIDIDDAFLLVVVVKEETRLPDADFLRVKRVHIGPETVLREVMLPVSAYALPGCLILGVPPLLKALLRETG